MQKRKDWTGVKIADVRFVRYLRRKGRVSIWECCCERTKDDGNFCGKTFEVRPYNVVSGRTTSCGCRHKDVVVELGARRKKNRSPLERHIINVRVGMLGRCYNRNHRGYKRYGGRGISMCERWRKSKDAFIQDSIKMGAGIGLQIDRINNDGDYTPDNCRWVTAKENNRNRSNNVKVSVGESVMTLSEFAEMSGIPYSIVSGWRGSGTIDRHISELLAGRLVVNGVLIPPPMSKPAA